MGKSFSAKKHNEKELIEELRRIIRVAQYHGYYYSVPLEVVEHAEKVLKEYDNSPIKRGGG